MPRTVKALPKFATLKGISVIGDELRRRHPGMLIDSCASGGRRDDLETMRRAVPILPTDVENDAEGVPVLHLRIRVMAPVLRSHEL